VRSPRSESPCARSRFSPLRRTCPAAAPSGPGDILTAANGKTIEVINTDAEGRLVLADALWYARREGATHVVDMATLTGAMSLALGDLYSGIFANDEAWLERIVAAGESQRRPRLAVPAPLSATAATSTPTSQT
jgi:leucyl aminopeptidase